MQDINEHIAFSQRHQCNKLLPCSVILKPLLLTPQGRHIAHRASSLVAVGICKAVLQQAKEPKDRSLFSEAAVGACLGPRKLTVWGT